MKVARLHANGQIRLQDEPGPEPVAGESLLRVKAVGVCGSDLHWFAEGGIGDARLDMARRTARCASAWPGRGNVCILCLTR
jgi:threonine dehydrogenase-like Zn-dependent dehydrogenase